MELIRACVLKGIPEVSELEKGMDFRKIEYRREVFFRFYKFHTMYGIHPAQCFLAYVNILKRI